MKPRASIVITVRAAGSSAKRRDDLVEASASRQRRGRHAPRLPRGASPPGRRSGGRWPMRRNAAPSTRSSSPPHACRRCRGRRRRARGPAPVLRSDARPSPPRRGRDDAARRSRGTPRRRASAAACRVLKKSGCRSCAIDRGSTSRIADQVVDGLDQRLAGRRVVEIADVLRDERLVAARDADRVLEIAAQRDDEGPGRASLIARGV